MKLREFVNLSYLGQKMLIWKGNEIVFHDRMCNMNNEYDNCIITQFYSNEENEIVIHLC